MEILKKVFKTLSDPTRVRVLTLLEREELAVQELMDVLGMAQSRVSRHLAILREEGSNGDREMTSAFHTAGFETWDVAMSDLAAGRVGLDGFRGLVAVGGFSYADVMDAAKGWAGVIRFNEAIRDSFERFRARPDTFSLGVCNGCQLLALLGWVPWSGIPDAVQPRFIHNASGRFESRFPSVRIQTSPAIMLRGMEGSTLGVWMAHGEGRAWFPDPAMLEEVERRELAPLRFVDDAGRVSEDYPFEGPIERAEALKLGNIVFKRRLTLPPGQYLLEVAGQDRTAGKTSVARARFDVPSSGGGLSMSSLALIRRVDDLPPETQSDDPLDLYNQKRIVPNLDAPISLATNPKLWLFFIAYPGDGGDAPEMTLEFLKGGKTIAKAKTPLPAPEPDGLIRYIGNFPTTKFSEGRYDVKVALHRAGSQCEEEASFTLVR